MIWPTSRGKKQDWKLRFLIPKLWGFPDNFRLNQFLDMTLSITSWPISDTDRKKVILSCLVYSSQEAQPPIISNLFNQGYQYDSENSKLRFTFWKSDKIRYKLCLFSSNLGTSPRVKHQRVEDKQRKRRTNKSQTSINWVSATAKIVGLNSFQQ